MTVKNDISKNVCSDKKFNCVYFKPIFVNVLIRSVYKCILKMITYAFYAIEGKYEKIYCKNRF